MHINVLLRVTSGNQFGLDEDNIREIVEKREAYPYVHILGLQAYTGTQKKKFEIVEKEIDWLDGLCDELKEKYGFVATEFEYGPGLKVDYFGKDAYNNNFDELKKLSKKLVECWMPLLRKTPNIGRLPKTTGKSVRSSWNTLPTL